MWNLRQWLKWKLKMNECFPQKQTQVLATYIKTHWYGFTYTVMFSLICFHTYVALFFFSSFVLPFHASTQLYSPLLQRICIVFYLLQLHTRIASSPSTKNILVFLRHLLNRYILKIFAFSLFFVHIFVVTLNLLYSSTLKKKMAHWINSRDF